MRTFSANNFEKKQGKIKKNHPKTKKATVEKHISLQEMQP
jgi:hypothetical protein